MTAPTTPEEREEWRRICASLIYWNKPQNKSFISARVSAAFTNLCTPDRVQRLLAHVERLEAEAIKVRDSAFEDVIIRLVCKAHNLRIGLTPLIIASTQREMQTAQVVDCISLVRTLRSQAATPQAKE